MGMPSGRVIFFNTERGFGFIAPDGGGFNVFVHVHDVEAAGMKILVAGQLVAYEVGLARDGRSRALGAGPGSLGDSRRNSATVFKTFAPTSI
jgi:CspA family cold shock protein